MLHTMALHPHAPNGTPRQIRSLGRSRRRTIASLGCGLVVALAMATDAAPASAQGIGPSPFGFGFQPFGFYQPYGATYGTSLRTPPYFALNPPVYYGARHARPYGISPFASPPVVGPGDGYRSRLRSRFPSPIDFQYTPDFRRSVAPLCNPFVHNSPAKPVSKVVKAEAVGTKPSDAKTDATEAKVVNHPKATVETPVSPIRSNPFVEGASEKRARVALR